MEWLFGIVFVLVIIGLFSSDEKNNDSESESFLWGLITGSAGLAFLLGGSIFGAFLGSSLSEDDNNSDYDDFWD